MENGEYSPDIINAPPNADPDVDEPGKPEESGEKSNKIKLILAKS